MLTVFACSPNQFQSTQEYDDVYFTSADRTSKPTIIESTKEIESSNEKAFSLGDYSSESIDPSLVSKYNNSQDGEVVYFEEGPLVTKASELNYDDFVYDYENENLAYYELPLDWNTDWDKWSFNKLMANDFQFQLAWYEQYYLNRDFRMNNYLSGRYGSRRNGGTVPRVGLDLFGASSFYPGFGVSMSFVSLNNFYGPSNLFWSPIYDPFWTYGGFYSPYYTAFSYGRPYPRYGWDRWNRYSPYYSYNRYYTSNYYYNNEGSLVNRDGRDVTRGARISSTSVSSVRTDAVNGSTPNTRSARYASDLGARGSRAGGSTDGYQVIGGRNSSTATTAGNTRSSRVNTNAYQFSNDSRLTRSNVVRSSTARSSRSTSTTSRVTSGRSSSSSSNLFSRSSSTRSATPTYSRSSSSSRSSGVSSSRSSSSSSRSSGVSSSRSSSSSSSRSSGTVSSSSSRSSSSSSRSGNTSSSSSSRSSSNSSSRSGRGN
ncbi:hypothetical protein EV198_2292 [Roseivirga ehrenbergii]|uniref:Uncharacterized protein n=2 Tax=Roseivirga ehrenbergii (strain DSM 102268 / JCM 13514 / KCTC 12282 / NCIMB 14502 / KMM 6017) TaxID=279360 RepID=A0A150XPF0_ROSEK|nr:hypothetical protein MB14_15800 [Roseivirga ehrenbergii]TCL07857.1 hypothetical protein EV198_2292 [Roseivirga ehrenbergii]